MLLRILIAVFICVLAIFVLMWILTGGPSRALSFAQKLRNPAALFGTGDTTGTPLKLPWQMDVAVPDAGQTSDDALASEQTQLDATQNQYDVSVPTNDPKTFGAPSPYRGQVGFSLYGSKATESDPALEYVSIQASNMNTSPVSLSGWSLQSALTGERVLVPQAADPLIAGVLNTVVPPTLDPGASATIVSGPSPVGVSFRENSCTGYLNELQRFVPELDTSTCPDPADSFPITAENLQTYGDSCIDYLRGIPRCHFPGGRQVNGISPACTNFAANVLSYNGCVHFHSADQGFKTNSWRSYIAAGVEIWRNSHDVIRLLDAQGRTVDVLTY